MLKMELLGVAVENILVGVLSAGFIVFVAFIRKKIYNLRMERKYPVAGKYLTKFEDEINGDQIVITAPAKLKQKGQNILGESEMPNESRKWILEGKISSGGHIHGVYYAEDPYDKGIGNFFLYINYKRQMEGLWSGFDSLNKKISSGRYYFEPILENILIRDAEARDLPRILEISDSELGENYLGGQIESELVSGNTIFRVAESLRDGIVGFSYSYISTGIEIKQKSKIKSLPKSIELSSKIALLKTIAVSGKMAGKGIGSSLMRDTFEKFKNLGVESVCCVAWKSSKGINIGGLMSLFKFTKFKELNNFWKQDSLTQNYYCLECGKPCLCSAVIFTKTL